MSGTFSSANGGSPQPGDLIIAFVGHRWELRHDGGDAVLTWPRSDAAVTFMRPFAEAHGLDIWIARDDGFDRIVQQRR